MTTGQTHFKRGDNVTFDTNLVEAFEAETNVDTKEIQQYRELVLAGANQVGIVLDFSGELVTVSYPDGWVIPIPRKFLILLPRI